jgi:hypothetical protein
VINLDKFFKSRPGKSIDQALIDTVSQRGELYLKSGNEYKRQVGRKIEAAVERAAMLEAEYEGLQRVAYKAWRTPVTEFSIGFVDEILALQKVHATLAKQLTIQILADALKDNRLQYQDAYLLLLKA